MPFVCILMEILAMFEVPSLFNGAVYLNKRRALDILNIVLLVHVGCVAGFTRNKPSKISCLSSNKARPHDLMKHSKSNIMC